MQGVAALETELAFTLGGRVAPIGFGGRWLWDIDNSGFSIVDDQSGFYVDNTELADILLSATIEGVQQLGADIAQVAQAAYRLPAIGDEFYEATRPNLVAPFNFDRLCLPPQN
jgi:hypothetical protein